MTNPTLFDQFKKPRPGAFRQKSVPQVLFQILFEQNTARLLVVDQAGVSITADYRYYSGATRGVLKALSLLTDKDRKMIRWGKEKPGVNLSENSFLIWQLKRCENVVDEQGQPIRFSEDEGRLILEIDGAQQLECTFALKVDHCLLRDVRILSEIHVLCQNTVYQVSQVGVDYATLCSFQTLLLPSDLEKYLSLFCSHCRDLAFQYRDYTVVSGSRIEARPSILIEKIAPDNSLFLKALYSITGFDPDFCQQFELTHVVSVSDSEKEIQIREIECADPDLPSAKVRKSLAKLKNESETPLGFYQDDSFFIVEPPLSEMFIKQVLPQLLPEFTVFGAEKLRSYKVSICKPELSLSLDHGIDFLEGSADLIVQGERFSLFEALYQFKRNAYINLSDGTQAILDHDYVQKLERIFQKAEETVNVSFFDLPLLEELIEERIKGKRYEDAAKIFSGFMELQTQTVEIPSINATLRPYQEDGYKWLRYLHRNALGGCLADDMGLGKTLQAITMLSFIYPDQTIPSLIIVPKSLIFNWLSEIGRFCPQLTVSTYHGAERELQSAMTNQLVVTTYGTVRSDIELLKDASFYYLILDESQAIKNHESQISRAVSILKAQHRLALSGTPIENNLSELYSLFRFLNPGMFGDLAKFNRQYLFPIQQTGNRDVARELKKKIYPFILRRLKKDVLKDLPEKVEKVIQVEMGVEQKKFYEQRRSFYYDMIRNRIESEGIKKSQFFILQSITILRQIASIPEVKTDGRIISPKRELLSETLEEAITNNHKVLLFANFLGALEYLALDLREKGIDYESLTGATQNREIPVKRFQSDPDCKVFLMTLKAGGQGLNLTAADTIYIYDPWWNLAAENQAIDRSHRIGQDKTVFSYKLITKDSIEERILSLQQKKKAVFDHIISDESMSYHHFNEDDIDYLIR